MDYNWLEMQADVRPEKTAVVFNGKKLSFRDLYEEALSVSKKLNAQDRRRIGFFIDNTVESVILIHAAMLAKIEIVMINRRLTEVEIDRQMTDVGVDTIVATKKLSMDGYRIVDYGGLIDLEGVSGNEEATAGAETLSIMFTSGTTGRAKAVRQSYENHYESAIGCEQRFSYGPGSVWMNVNPIYHISGFSILMRSVIRGCTMILIEKFEPLNVWRELEEHEVTHVSMVPVMLGRMMEHEGRHNLEGILLGGAGVTMDLLDRALERGFPVYNSFGMTETCSQIVSIAPEDPKILKGTVGRPLDNISIKIDGENEDELLVKGPAVTTGYVNAELSLDEGYFRTGDIGRIDDDGYLYILDRRSDLIISGGENIYPKEIEDAAAAHASVRKSVVIKQKDPEWGEVPVLLIELEEGAGFDRTAVMAVLEQRLARYKLPKEIHETKEVIMTSTGKVSRMKNLEAFETEKNSSM
ncbi:o-succinylbenzoate--CoA ligase [Salinicoccus carnicancri]|uniref:o-succinylbenzoate--CoA ligase n=1 Tax=Salinicoccus carnicancri TaxID=558170 RepID=UPI00030EA164|nr:o-succinylbenzoate--CoA ligase [Salinicoccus carnicancri]